MSEFYQGVLQGVPKNLLESGGQCIVASSLSFVFPGCLTRLVINRARVFLFNSTINWHVDVQRTVIKYIDSCYIIINYSN